MFGGIMRKFLVVLAVCVAAQMAAGLELISDEFV